MFKALLPCVCQLGDRTGSSACRKWKICHIVSKLCSGCAAFRPLLPFALCSLVWSCVDFCQSQLPPRGGQHENTHTHFTGRPIKLQLTERPLISTQSLHKKKFSTVDFYVFSFKTSPSINRKIISVLKVKIRCLSHLKTEVRKSGWLFFFHLLLRFFYWSLCLF